MQVVLVILKVMLWLIINLIIVIVNVIVLMCFDVTIHSLMNISGYFLTQHEVWAPSHS